MSFQGTFSLSHTLTEYPSAATTGTIVERSCLEENVGAVFPVWGASSIAPPGLSYDDGERSVIFLSSIGAHERLLGLYVRLGS